MKASKNVQHFTVLLPLLCLLLTTASKAKSNEYQQSMVRCSNYSAVSVDADPLPVISYGSAPYFCQGGTITLTSSSGVHYQWYKNGTAISESDTPSLVVSEAGSYQVLVDDGSASVASLEVLISEGNHWTGNGNDENWMNAVNWSCGEIPQANDMIFLDSSGFDAVISGDELVTINKLQIDGTAVMRVTGGSTLQVTDAIHIAPTAQLIIDNQASLVQVSESANIGSITVHRFTSPMKRYDFTYWSSPVIGQTLHDLSPETLGDKYYSFSPIIGNWVSHNLGALTMEPGTGYIVRAPQNFSTATPAVFDASFIGTPNNGTIYTPVNVGLSDMNLIGNPYPSAVDMDAFLTDPANAALVDGTIYFWTHHSAPAVIPGDNTYNYTSNDYAAYNLMGGLATANPGNSTRPEGKVSSGQSFFIKALASGSVVFRNDMRVGFLNNQFYHPVQSSSIEKHRLWLSISNDQGAYKQTLLGFTTGATNSIDREYDGVTLNGNTFLDFYSIEAGQKLAIQGRALPFDSSTNIPLGFNATIAGSFVLALDDFDGLFSTQDVYLYDNETMILHNLRSGSYSFSTLVGRFDNRFDLRFTDDTLSAKAFVANSTVVTVKDNNITIEASQPFDNVALYDLAGRLVYEVKALNQTMVKITDLRQSGVFVIEITFLNGDTVIKKLIR